MMENLPHLSLSSLELIEHALLSEMSRLERRFKKVEKNPLKNNLEEHKRILGTYRHAYREVRDAVSYSRSFLSDERARLQGRLVLDILEAARGSPYSRPKRIPKRL